MDRTLIIRVPVGRSILHIETTDQGGGGERPVAGIRPNFAINDVLAPIEELSKGMLSTLRAIGPNKATIEFGIEVGAEAGQLTALLVKGTGKANLKITLNWENLNQVPQDQMSADDPALHDDALRSR